MRIRSRSQQRRAVHRRQRRHLSGSHERPRLAVWKSSRNIVAQVIDDGAGRTLASASTLEKGAKGTRPTSGNVAAAKAVGELVAERALSQGIAEVVFDRGGFRYHGAIKALADAARAKGLKF